MNPYFRLQKIIAITAGFVLLGMVVFAIVREGARHEGQNPVDSNGQRGVEEQPLADSCQTEITGGSKAVEKLAGIDELDSLHNTPDKGAANSIGKGRLLDAIRQTESTGNDLAIGDSGCSRGPYQIKKDYWAEAIVGTDAAEWDYMTHVWDPDRARYVVWLHWEQVCPAALYDNDLELLARCHRLPNDPWRASNDVYWAKIEREIER